MPGSSSSTSGSRRRLPGCRNMWTRISFGPPQPRAPRASARPLSTWSWWKSRSRPRSGRISPSATMWSRSRRCCMSGTWPFRWAREANAVSCSRGCGWMCCAGKRSPLSEKTVWASPHCSRPSRGCSPLTRARWTGERMSISPTMSRRIPAFTMKRPLWMSCGTAIPGSMR